MCFFPKWTNAALTSVQSGIYRNLSWSYILLVSFFFIFLVVLAFSKLGNIRLGADNILIITDTVLPSFSPADTVIKGNKMN
ncbi:BCCT family transporter [Prevotella micans]|uniref:BCCT family transporter n=1 Tax=Prevotella micans TaxID=189723 RepID=UPI0005602B83|nr:BCCT family transporter [Prevotella micans]